MAPSFPWHELPAPALERLAELCGFATVLALECTNKAEQRQAATMPLHGVHAADQAAWSAAKQQASYWLAANCHRVTDLAGEKYPDCGTQGPWPLPLAPSSKPWSLLKSIKVGADGGWEAAFAGGAPQLSSLSSGDVLPGACLAQYSSTLRKLSCQIMDLSLDASSLALLPLTGLVELEWTNDFDRLALGNMSHLTQLRKLSIRVWMDDKVERDLSPLTCLTNLASLDLTYTRADDWSPLASLTTLTWLSLADSNFSDTCILAALTWLRHLRLSSSAVSEIRAVAQLTNLEQLHMPFLEDVEDLSPLARLPALKVLDIADTLITSLASLDVARIANIDRLSFKGAHLRYYDLFFFACHNEVVLELGSRHAGSWQNLWVRCSNTPVARASVMLFGSCCEDPKRAIMYGRI